jgi:hypothetical protein
MAAFFTRERFGRPQLYASLLLLIFAAQCLWIIWLLLPRQGEIDKLRRGLAQWRHGEVAVGPESPLVALTASAAVAPFHDSTADRTELKTRAVALLSRLPFLLIGLLRGASLWYVTRRLYGNSGGYIALTLYCFSLPIILSSLVVNGEGPSAWGFFGAIFSGIALSHTLYALGESSRQQLTGFRQWRWRRIVLLGIAFGIAIGAQHAVIFVVPLALGFMLYLAPRRHTACLAITAVASTIAFFVLWATYFFRLDLMSYGMTQTSWFPRERYSVTHVGTWQGYGFPLLCLAAGALLTYGLWRRARYFGNSAPLLVLILLAAGSLIAPWALVFEQHAITFAFVFIAGVMADLLETAQRKWVLPGLLLLLFAHAASMLTKVFWIYL